MLVSERTHGHQVTRVALINLPRSTRARGVISENACNAGARTRLEATVGGPQQHGERESTPLDDGQDRGPLRPAHHPTANAIEQIKRRPRADARCLSAATSQASTAIQPGPAPHRGRELPPSTRNHQPREQQ